MYRNTLVRIGLVAVVALLTFSAYAQTFSVIHTFTGGRDGTWPMAGVTLRNGVLYGTTYLGLLYGYDSGWGTVYQITHNGSNWITNTVYLFQRPKNDAVLPISRVVFGPDGHLYGMGQYGGDYQDSGAVYTVAPNPDLCRTANCFWNESVVHSFNQTDGWFGDFADLIFDQQGNMYGTTPAAGYNHGYHGNVFQITPSGSGWTETSLYSFSDSGGDGQAPDGVIFDKAGNLWGATEFGGANGVGTIYELKNVPGVGWQETIWHNFQTDTDGTHPSGSLILDDAGNFYGTTNGDGPGGGGTVYELSPSGNGWTFQVIYSFAAGPYDNCGPVGELAMDSAGNLYGTTFCDGAYQQGNVFKLAKTVNGWQYTSLHDFTAGSDGAGPVAGVTLASDGTIYGTASEGGSFAGLCQNYMGCGTVWMIKP